MNEKLIELANKANEDIGYTFKLEDAKQVHELMEKFAKLLVQECMLAVSKTPVSDDEVSIMVRCHDQIEKHFGVEE